MDRAFSDLTIRSVDEDKRILRGLATSFTLDRACDRIDPLGCTFKNPAILLLQHSHERPVGTVIFARPTQDGVGFTAHIPRIGEPGVLKDRTDEAWQSCRSKILRHVSIGFRPTQAPTPNEHGGYDYPAIEILELSLVSVACQPDAEILEVRRAGRSGTDTVLGLDRAREQCPVVRLSGVTRAALTGKLKIHSAPRRKPADPLKIIVPKKQRIVRLDREKCPWLQKSKEPARVVKLTQRDSDRAKHRAVKLGSR